MIFGSSDCRSGCSNFECWIDIGDEARTESILQMTIKPEPSGDTKQEKKNKWRWGEKAQEEQHIQVSIIEINDW